MVALSILIVQLVLSFSIFVFIATWYVTPKMRERDISNAMFERPETEPLNRGHRFMPDLENSYAIRGIFE